MSSVVVMVPEGLEPPPLLARRAPNPAPHRAGLLPKEPNRSNPPGGGVFVGTGVPVGIGESGAPIGAPIVPSAPSVPSVPPAPKAGAAPKTDPSGAFDNHGNSALVGAPVVRNGSIGSTVGVKPPASKSPGVAGAVGEVKDGGAPPAAKFPMVCPAPAKIAAS